MATASFNVISIRAKIEAELKKSRYQGLATSAANTRFVIAKQILLEDFDKSQITEELNQGNTAVTTLLPDSYGNLFSFLGFPAEEQPAQELRAYLQSRIVMGRNPKFSGTNNKYTYSFPVQNPSIQEVYDAFPMPDNWSSKSWVYAIEKGIGTFSLYVYHRFFGANSRSKTGLQRTKPRKFISIPDRALKIPYITPLLEAFRAKFNK